MKKIMKRMSSKKAEKGVNSNGGLDSSDLKDTSDLNTSVSSLVTDSKGKEETTPLKQQLSSSTISVSSSSDVNNLNNAKCINTTALASSSPAAPASSPAGTTAKSSTCESDVVKNVSESIASPTNNKEEKLEKLRKKQEERQQNLNGDGAASPIILLPDTSMNNVSGLALVDPAAAQVDADSLVSKQMDENNLAKEDDEAILFSDLKAIKKGEEVTRDEKLSPCADFVCCM